MVVNGNWLMELVNGMVNGIKNWLMELVNGDWLMEFNGNWLIGIG